MRILETIPALPVDALVAEVSEEYSDAADRAREFYRVHVERAFAASTAMMAEASHHRGRHAGEALTIKQVQPVLVAAKLGQYDSARKVGEQCVVRMWACDPSGETRPQDWWRNLLDYEYLLFLQLSTGELRKPGDLPARGMSANARTFRWDVSDAVMLGRSGSLNAGEFKPATEQTQTLLFTRDDKNRVFVVELDVKEAAVFRIVDGAHNADEIAQAAELNADETRRILQELAGIGAVVLP